MFGTIFILIWCTCIWPALMQTTSWDLVTPFPIKFSSTVELRCTVQGVATCCSGLTRRWNKGSTQVINNGVSGSPSKYSEIIYPANNQFSLIISKLDIDDLNVIYTCTYGNVSPQKTLALNDSFEWHPNESEITSTKINIPSSWSNRYKSQRSAVISKIAPRPTISAKFGENEIAVQSIITVYDTWFYNVTMSLNEDLICAPNKMLQITVTAGLYSYMYNIVTDDDCQCNSCAGYTLGYTVLGFFSATFVCFIVLMCWRISLKGKTETIVDTENVRKWDWISIHEELMKRIKQACLFVVIDVVMILLIVFLLPVLFGYFYCNCIAGYTWVWIVLGAVAFLLGFGVAYLCKQIKGWIDVFIFIIVFAIVFIILITLYKQCCDRKKQEPHTRHTEDHVALSGVPTVQIKKKQYVVRPGMTETLECTFNSTSPVTQVFWERTNDGTKTIIPITTDQEKNLGSTPRIPSLTIRDIEKSDAGTYRCVATNSAGNGYSSATKLIVTESSGVIAIYGIKDSKIIFVCPYKSTTSTSVLWSCDDTGISDGHKIADSQRKDRVFIVGDHKAGVYNLELSGLQESDEGVYRCNVGKQKQEYKLKVVGSDDPVINSPKGSSVMFACPYKSTTSTSVLWSCDDTEISVGPKITDSQRKDRVFIVGDHKAGVYNLELSGLQESDEGVYICNVGKQKQEYELKVVAGEKHNK